MKSSFIIAALLTVGLSAWGQQSRPSLADTLEFLHNAAAETVEMGAPNSYSFDSHGCDVTIHANGPMATTSHFSLKDVEPKFGLRGERGVSLTDKRPTVEIITFSISTTQLRKKIRVEFDSGDRGSIQAAINSFLLTAP